MAFETCDTCGEDYSTEDLILNERTGEFLCRACDELVEDEWEDDEDDNFWDEDDDWLDDEDEDDE